MKWISCGIDHKFRLLLFVAFFLFWILISLISRYLKDTTNPINLNCFFELLIIYCGRSLSGLFELIRIWKSQSPKQISKRKQKSTLSKVTIIQNLEFKNPKMKFIIYAIIALVSLLNISEYWCSSIIKNNTPYSVFQIRYQLKGFQIFPTILFFKLIIKQKLFFHHWVSLIMIIISLGAIMINAFIIADEPFELLFLELQYFGIFILIALIDTIYKWLMDIKGLSVYFLIFVEGIFGIVMIIILILALPSDLQSNGNMESFNTSVFRVFGSYYYILLVIGNVLMHCGYIIFVLLVIKYFSPIHKAVCESLYSCLWILEQSLFGKFDNMLDYITYIIGYVVIGIFGLIYNEIIVIHLCSLDKNTSKQIQLRSVWETTIVLEEIDFDEEGDEDAEDI